MKAALNCIATLALGVSLVLGSSSSARAGTFKHIVIDGDFSDWAGVPIAYTDPSEEAAAAGTDFKDVWIAHDADYVYVRFSLYNTNLLLRSQNNVFINADGDPFTGYAVHSTGSEMLIQSGTGYQEKNGTFNDGFLIQDLEWASAPAGPADEYEFRVSRRARYEDGADVFTSEAIAILLETENNNFAEVDIAKDEGPIEYTLDAAPPAAQGSVELIGLTSSDWLFNRSGADLGIEWRGTAYDDAQAGWETGKGLFGRTPNPAAYPAPITTPISDDHVTYYFRAKFNWDKDPAGISLIASNFLSDGAVIYLNGSEALRRRMPEGVVTGNTPATGSNPNPGQVEIFDFAPNALVIGENVLAVEVHQSAGDSAELVFGLSLLATDRLPASIITPTTPETVTVDEGASVTLTAAARGAAPIRYQWFKGTTPIPGATNATHTIAAVAPEDAGEYLVKVSNAGAADVSSAVITLEARAVPVTFTNNQLPSDLTVPEGAAAEFTAAVAGSQPISFQWFKDGVALADATNQTYQIPSVLLSHAGEYTLLVSNRITAPLTSRAARLTVNRDTIAPTLLSASGGGNRILLQFSEPIDAASLTGTAFTVSPALTVSQANLDPEDPSVVVLQTAASTLGTLYTVSAGGIKDRFGNAVTSARRQFRSAILIDGDFSDWEGVALAHSDPEDAGPETGAHADYKDIWIASDNDYVYVRFTLWREGDPFIFYNNIFVDADNDPATGYSFGGLGSEMLIQSGAGYEQKTAIFNDGGVENLDWLAAPEPPGTEFEVRFSRKATFADADAGGSVFKGPIIALVLESENTGFVAQDIAPDLGVGPIVHTLVDYEVTEVGPLALARNAGGVQITWSGAGKLQSTDSLSSPNWQDVTNAASPHSPSLTGPQRFYRLVGP